MAEAALGASESRPFACSLSIVIVAYNDARWLDECLSSIERYEGSIRPWDVVVVDNSDRPEVRDMIHRSHQNVTYVPNRNRGFGEGNNRGVAIAKGEILFFLNPDACLVGPLLHSVSNQFAANLRLGALGVRLVGREGARQHSFFWVDSGGVWKSLAQHLLVRMGIYLPRSMCTSGAALFVRREAFEAAGRFDSQMFLYNEESDLWRRLTSLGWAWRYDPSRVVSHLGGGTMPSRLMATSRRLESLRHYCAKYGLDFDARLRRELRYLRLTFKIKWVLGRFGRHVVDTDQGVIDEYEVALHSAHPDRR